MLITALIISLITFIRVFILDKEYGSLSINKKYDNNIINTNISNELDGYKHTSISVDLELIKSNIYNIKFSDIKNNELKINGNIINNDIISSLKKSDIVNIKDIFCKSKRKIKISYDDKFNNRYYQNLYLIPINKKKNSIEPWDVKISNRKLYYRSILNKYFK